MGAIFEKYLEFIKQDNPSEGRGYFKVIPGVELSDPDFNRDCQLVCLDVAQYSAQEKPDLILGEAIPQPLIGAALFINNELYVSSRSGLRIGDHAEFTIIQEASQKYKDFSGAILFTSLEPCTKHSRSKWTTSCSEYIIEKGIKKVFFGCLDANPAITGLGIQRLMDNCVVCSFDEDLILKARDLNKSFFSRFNSKVNTKVMKDVIDCIKPLLDENAVRIYMRKGSNVEISSDEWFVFFEKAIISHAIEPGLISKYDVNKEFALSFYSDPKSVLPGYDISIYDQRLRIKGTSTRRSSNKIEFDPKSIISLIAHTDNGLEKTNIYKVLQKAISKNKGNIKNFPNLLKAIFGPANIEAGRELLINAFVHADYCQNKGIIIEINDNNICVFNPISSGNILETLKERKPYSIPHNPMLMNYLSDAGLVEKKHHGMNMLIEKEGSTKKDIYSKEELNGVIYLKTVIDIV